MKYVFCCSTMVFLSIFLRLTTIYLFAILYEK